MELQTIGKYKVLGKIGQGSMGVVFKAQDPILNRFVAIKTMSESLGADADARKRFLREAQSAARLNHPNIVTVYDLGEEQGRAYLAMELLEGQDLRHLIGTPALGPIEEKLRIMEEVCDGLAFAHAKEVIHRDIKPANIHVQPNGSVKVMDFGLARLGTSEMTAKGTSMGTPNYMSPEQIRGEKTDARSDVFSLGTVFYEILTNHKAFDGDSLHTILAKVAEGKPLPARRWVADLPEILVRLRGACRGQGSSRAVPQRRRDADRPGGRGPGVGGAAGRERGTGPARARGRRGHHHPRGILEPGGDRDPARRQGGCPVARGL